MRRWTWLLAGQCVAFVFHGSAGAADMPVKARPVPTISWGGWYAGAAIGSRWTDAEWNTTAILQPGFAPLPPSEDSFASFGKSTSRFAGFAGVNYQSGDWVWGVEGDVGIGFDSKRTINGIPGSFSFASFSIDPDRTTVETGWDASLRARLGMLIAPNILFYGTGGVAFQDTKLTVNCGGNPGTCGTPVTVSASKVLTGWTGGLGIEAVLGANLLARFEYRYADFGSFGQTFLLGPTASNDVVTSTQIRTHTTSLGLAYKFGPQFGTSARAEPVMAANWTGFYVGAGVGAKRSEGVWTTGPLLGGAIQGDTNSPVVFDRVSPEFHGYAGFNWQVGSFVAGVEGELGTATDTRRTLVGVPGTNRNSAFPPNPDRSSVDMSWSGSVVGRLGVLMAPNTLLYGVGGAAWQETELQASCQDFVNGGSFCSLPHSESVSKTLSGYTVGGGLEVARGSWLFRGEYRYANFGTFSHQFFVSPGNPDTLPVSVAVETHRVSFGVAYKFGPM